MPGNPHKGTWRDLGGAENEGPWTPSLTGAGGLGREQRMVEMSDEQTINLSWIEELLGRYKRLCFGGQENVVGECNT